jgi:hypothetical protein
MNNGLTNIRQIEAQSVESEREITGAEAEELLRKYGYGEPQRFSTRQEPVQPNPNANLSFEEMIRQEEEKRKVEEQRKMAKINGPKPITFNSNSGYESEVKWGSDDEMGFGFKIEITTDMKLPK